MGGRGTRVSRLVQRIGWLLGVLHKTDLDYGSLLGAPTGTKNTSASITLPTYLDDAPESIRREFVDVYLKNRGQRYDHKATIHFREDRSTGYLDALAALIADVSGERVTRSDRNVIVSADAARALEA